MTRSIRLFFQSGICCLTCLFSFCSKSGQSNGSANTTPPVPPADTTKTYSLVWSDEFDGSAVNTAYWNFETGGDGWGNHEKEYYQAANATVANGNLVITAKKENAGTNGYTSARMTTQGKKEFFYGKIEARIQVPVGQGFWPAFWMLGSSISSVPWPACGETDIMEHINTDSTYYGTIHWDNGGHVQDGGQAKATNSEFHIYSVEWDANSITWSIDSIPFHQSSITASSMSEFHQPFFIILNFAIGGDWPGQTVNDALLPASMLVDWVRVYQKK